MHASLHALFMGYFISPDPIGAQKKKSSTPSFNFINLVGTFAALLIF